jgi:hypothetical protein
MVTRTDVDGPEAEPLLAERDDRGWVTLTLDDGETLEFDPAAVTALQPLIGAGR